MYSPKTAPESEAALLGAMIINNDCIGKVLSAIKEEDFSIDNHKLVFTAIADAYKTRGAVDLVILKDQLGPLIDKVGGVDFIASLAEQVPGTSIESAGAYLGVVEEAARKRHALTIADGIREYVAGGKPYSEILELIQSAKGARLQDKWFSIEAAIGEAKKGIEVVKKDGVDLKTGWKEVDSLIGGVRRKILYTVGAKTSNGKTSVACNLAWQNLTTNPKCKILYAGFENIEQIPYRLASIHMGTPLAWFLKPDQIKQKEYDLASEALESLKEFKDRMVIMNGPSILQLRAMCDEFKPDIVFFDYIQRYAHKFGLAQEGRLSHEVGKLVSDLQDLAIDKNCSVFAFSQLKRRMEEHKARKPDIGDLKESGDTENYSDVILLLWWPWRDGVEGQEASNYYVCVAKNKMGPCEDVMLRMHPETLTIGNLRG